MIFARSKFSEIRITLRSNETLGELDSSYIEDYYGTGGQVSLYHFPTDIRYPVLVNEVAESTPDIPQDVFRGFASLETLPDGVYEIQGRVRDLIGNYTILGTVANPRGDERQTYLRFTVVSGETVVEVFAPVLNIVPLVDVALSMDSFIINMETNVFTVNVLMDKSVVAKTALPKPSEANAMTSIVIKMGDFIE